MQRGSNKTSIDFYTLFDQKRLLQHLHLIPENLTIYNGLPDHAMLAS